MRQKIILALLCSCSFVVMASDIAAPVDAEKHYIQNALIQKGIKLGLDNSPELLDQVENFRKEQLVRLTIEAESVAGMPDFSARAEELYQVRKDKQYNLPLRLRVRVLELEVPEEKAQAIQAELETIRGEVVAGKQDFKTAVMEHSKAVDLRLAQGDSYWFHKEQKSAAFFAAAEALSADKPLSDVFIDQGKAYLLGFLDRKEAEIRSFDQVKPEIIAELQQEYRKDQQKMLLETLRKEFQQQSAAKSESASQNTAM
ncbi:peptidylprolyl isomerase [Thiothrix litoralis]|jgi:hypothetical protein|uniref:Peptidylprolyl isomerase n=1 Tax=Thiothrix litoralis TaxID=2891210 RepID=A0ABX7WN00_9GAMM|nr:peptidylprolyl isomerase [Thiothrix litoralis]QTR44929.1 peptidylprolyl isomerase [Thiothrix litoralis]